MSLFDYLLCAFVCILFICMFIFLTEDEWGEKPKIYSKGYVILFGLASFIPYFNTLFAMALMFTYIMLRANGVLKLKHTEFTEKWFGVTDD